MRKASTCLFLIILIACEKDISINDKIDISTDRETYMNLMDIVIRITNNSENDLVYEVCNGKIPYGIEKYADENWGLIYSPVCNAFQSYCCKALIPGQEYLDTIKSNWLDAGKYRLVYSFEVNNSANAFYSNTFKIGSNK